MATMQKIHPHLWFDNQAEAAAKYYTSIFDNSSITRTTYYGKTGQEIHKMPEGSVMVVEFEILGQKFMALNGGPLFKFSEAISFMIECEDQAEIDDYWKKLTAGGDPSAQQCGWLKDKFGLSWQVVPRQMQEWLSHNDEKSQRLMTAMMEMKKIDIRKLLEAYNGTPELV